MNQPGKPDLESAPQLLQALEGLRLEVRAMSRRALRTLDRVSRDSEIADAWSRVEALYVEWLNRADARTRVICFASAAELGIALPVEIESRDLALFADCDGAVRALYWTAVKRLQSRRDAAIGAEPHGHDCQKAPPANHSGGRTVPCQQCERLRQNSRAGQGHAALREIGLQQWRYVGAGARCQTRQFQCMQCETRWSQCRNQADPFFNWVIDRTVRNQ